MSVITTRTCIPFSKARYSAAVNAQRGVTIRSIDGASASDWNITTFDKTPEASKVSTKNFATSYLMPIPAKTITNFSSLFRNFACLII